MLSQIRNDHKAPVNSSLKKKKKVTPFNFKSFWNILSGFTNGVNNVQGKARLYVNGLPQQVGSNPWKPRVSKRMRVYVCEGGKEGSQLVSYVPRVFLN